MDRVGAGRRVGKPAGQWLANFCKAPARTRATRPYGRAMVGEFLRGACAHPGDPPLRPGNGWWIFARLLRVPGRPAPTTGQWLVNFCEAPARTRATRPYGRAMVGEFLRSACAYPGDPPLRPGNGWRIFAKRLCVPGRPAPTAGQWLANFCEAPVRTRATRPYGRAMVGEFLRSACAYAGDPPLQRRP